MNNLIGDFVLGEGLNNLIDFVVEMMNNLSDCVLVVHAII